MNRHRHVWLLLYEYLMEELDPAEKAVVEQHLIDCRKCREECTRLREVLAIVPRPKQAPGETLPQEFWNAFVAMVERRTSTPPPSRIPALSVLADFIHGQRAAISGRGWSIVGVAAAAAVAAVVFTVRSGLPSPTPPESVIATQEAATRMPPDTSAQDTLEHDALPLARASTRPHPPKMRAAAATANDLLASYFRRSKTLLIGITNAQRDSSLPVDLTSETRVSRLLVKESRDLLSMQPLTPRTERLVGALQRVLIEFSTVAEEKDSPGIEVVRDGIQQENLLFRIRMAELAFNTDRQTSPSTIKERL